MSSARPVTEEDKSVSTCPKLASSLTTRDTVAVAPAFLTPLHSTAYSHLLDPVTEVLVSRICLPGCLLHVSKTNSTSGLALELPGCGEGMYHCVR